MTTSLVVEKDVLDSGWQKDSDIDTSRARHSVHISNVTISKEATLKCNYYKFWKL